MKIWAKTEEFSEGKYLVIRRDGTVPAWPHFVLGGDDPNSSWALRAYAVAGQAHGLDPEYVASIHELANDFEKRTGGKADPDAGPHRVDLPIALEMMRYRVDLAQLDAAYGPFAADRVTPRVSEWLGRQRSNVLWCVHIIGPDDLIAARDHRDAQRIADEVMAVAAANANMDDIMCLPVVEVWPGDASSHARDLAKRAEAGA